MASIIGPVLCGKCKDNQLVVSTGYAELLWPVHFYSALLEEEGGSGVWKRTILSINWRQKEAGRNRYLSIALVSLKETISQSLSISQYKAVIQSIGHSFHQTIK